MGTNQNFTLDASFWSQYKGNSEENLKVRETVDPETTQVTTAIIQEKETESLN